MFRLVGVSRHDLTKTVQPKLVRYADDFVVLCRKDVERPLDTIKWRLEKLELTLKEGKTNIVDANETSFRFLGFDLKMACNGKGVRYPYVEASDKAVEKIKTRLKEITERNQTWRPIDDIVRDMNRALRGWEAYFF
jgi:RNA-directed DNA polymerase